MKDKKITLDIHKKTISKEGKIYLTVHHYLAENFPSLVFKKSNYQKFRKQNEKKNKSRNKFK